MNETKAVENQCDAGTLVNQEKERPSPTSTFNSISSSTMANNKRTNADSDLLPLDDVDGQPEEEEWENIGEFIASVMRSMKSDAQRQRLKIDVMTVLLKYQHEDDEYSKLFHLNNINSTDK